MNVLGVFLTSYVIGLLFLGLVKGKQPFRAIDYFLAVGLGVGISSQVVFYILVCLNRFDPWVSVVVHMILVAVLGVMNISKYRGMNLKSSLNVLSLCRFFILCSPFLFFIVFLAFSKPYGDWDGWSLWNYRANFILRSGVYWHDIFVNGLQGNHPWLLPFFVAHGWGMLGEEGFLIPLLTGVLFCTATLGVLIFELLDRFGPKIAICSGIFICTVPAFATYSVTQYSDVLVAYYGLVAVTCLLRAVRLKSDSDFFLSGLMFGFLAFCKDHGIVIAVIFIILSLIFYRRFLGGGVRFFWGGAGLVLPAIITVKYWMAAKPSVIYNFGLDQIFDPHRLAVLGKYVWLQMFGGGVWGAFWIMFLAALVIGFKRLSQPENRILFYFCFVYLIIFLLSYLVSSFDIRWCLQTTFHRVVFQILPVAQLLISGLLAERIQNNPSGIFKNETYR